MPGGRPGRPSRQTGTATIEFAIIAIFFLTIVFATLELARIGFLLNALQEATRRAAAAAAKVDYRDTAALEKVRADAVFRSSPGPLALGAPVTSDNVKIDYLSVSKTLELTHMSTLPTCPAGNRWNCLTDPQADNCIRYVRVRICAAMDMSGNCTQVSYQMVFPFLDLSGMKLPTAETIVPAGSLGLTPGSVPCT